MIALNAGTSYMYMRSGDRVQYHTTLVLHDHTVQIQDKMGRRDEGMRHGRV